ncbi:MAG: hypothetical protein NTW21_12185 [Verrucomicrobia bacterium]|nr:hypothetical protein [Verrucomicrobiota bacterium]
MLNESAEAVFQETNSRLHLALFGKHPGWNDHMEDLGLSTPSLLEFKRRVYYEGISGRLDCGAWRNLAPEGRIEAFDHELLWTGPTGVIFAILWHSTDGGGRAAYPMVAAAHFLTGRLPAKVEPVFDALQLVADECRTAPDRDAVKAAQARGSERLIQTARALVPMSSQTWSREDRENFINHASFGEGGDGFTRLFYALTEYQNLTPAAKHTFCYRVTDGGAGPEAIALWQTLMRAQMEASHSLLAMRCRHCPWVDLLAGEFPAEEFFRLKAKASEIPLVTDVPYSVPEELKEQTRMVLESFLDTPELMPKLDACGSAGPGQRTLGSLLSKIFRTKS